MDLYTLDRNFLKQDIIDEFRSVIWTERYSRAGDFQLVVPATSEMIGKLSEGLFLATPRSRETMIIETQSIENGLLTVSGSTLDMFLNNRVALYSKKQYNPYLNYVRWQRAAILNDIVSFFVRPGRRWNLVGNGMLAADNEALLTSYTLDGPREVIPNLIVSDDWVGGGDESRVRGDFSIEMPNGMLYDVISRAAEQLEVGFSLIVEGADFNSGTYSLVFRAYEGRDLTSDQDTNPLVRFSQGLGTLDNVRELRSISQYKNVCYARASNLPERMSFPTPGGGSTEVEIDIRLGKAFVDGGDTAVGFDRRVLLIDYTELSVDVIRRATVPETFAAIEEILDRQARDALANNNFIRMVDGEVSPNSTYQFERDYGLGDIIELQGYSGTLQKARVTEYIRSEDETGERGYPTISIID